MKTKFNREDFKTVLPQLEKRLNGMGEKVDELNVSLNTLKSDFETSMQDVQEQIATTPKDTGWRTLTLSSEFTAYIQGKPPLYRRVGNTVYVQGAVSPTGAYEGGTTTHVIGNLPVGFRPTQAFGNISDTTVSTIQQGSGLCSWHCRVLPAGNITFARYRNADGYANVGTSTWLPFTITFMTDDDFPE